MVNRGDATASLEGLCPCREYLKKRLLGPLPGYSKDRQVPGYLHGGGVLEQSPPTATHTHTHPKDE